MYVYVMYSTTLYQILLVVLMYYENVGKFYESKYVNYL